MFCVQSLEWKNGFKRFESGEQVSRLYGVETQVECGRPDRLSGSKKLPLREPYKRIANVHFARKYSGLQENRPHNGLIITGI